MNAASEISEDACFVFNRLSPANKQIYYSGRVRVLGAYKVPLDRAMNGNEDSSPTGQRDVGPTLK